MRIGLDAVIAVALGGPQSTTTSGYRIVSGPVWNGGVARRGTTPFLFPGRNEGGQDVAADDVVPFFGVDHSSIQIFAPCNVSRLV